MHKKYGLVKLVLGSSAFVEIPHSQYMAIKSARDFLITVLSIERKYDILIENYLEFESELSILATRDAICMDVNYKDIQSDIRLLNRRLANLLASGRTYIDTTPKSVAKLKSFDVNLSIDVPTELRAQYDNRVGYRVMEALRNYALHYGDPLFGITRNRNRIETEGSNKLRFVTTPYHLCSKLREDEGFKKSVLKELENEGEKVSLKKYVRDYITGLSQVHAKIRMTLLPQIELHESCHLSAMEKYKTKFPETQTLLGLAAVESTSDTKIYSNPVAIFQDLIDYRLTMFKKNHELTSLEKRYVSSEIID